MNSSTIGLIIGAGLILLVLYILFYSGKPDPDVALQDVLLFAYPKQSYVDIFRRCANSGSEILLSLPCHYDAIEFYAFLYAIGFATVYHVGGNAVEYDLSLKMYIDSILPVDKSKLLDLRCGFYMGVCQGAGVRGDWSLSDLPPSILSVAMLRAAVAFGDCLTNPELIDDYDGAPVLVTDIRKAERFQRGFTGDFFSLVHTYCVMLAGGEFDPPIIEESRNDEEDYPFL
ncbi:MAG: hypothetical protein IJT43_00615 [Stomatobaculum sp.]|nr:hypothetical protein [Stomatobaculum sp.]